ncbi:complement factor H-like isoform X2 [Channa argus]|uniref:complement factor H-like isoform X2 n=1 Tax=Channa argus TaxID=215402 RepID=UPI00351FE69B
MSSLRKYPGQLLTVWLRKRLFILLRSCYFILDKMSVRYLGFVLLIWFLGELRAQSAAQPCSAPTLLGGYFFPDQNSYSHKTSLSYACEDGRKPAAEGWWATSTCENGVWSPKPQCIGENLCLSPNIPNAIYRGTQNGWYEEGEVFRVTCDKGYKLKNQAATARCNNGTWSSLPICERDIHSCGEPPKVPHAVIINQEYQELFAVDSEVQYKCEDGYTTEGGNTTKSIFCISGAWTEGPICRDIHSCGEPPKVPHAVIINQEYQELFAVDSEVQYKCEDGYTTEGGNTTKSIFCLSGAWTEGPICRSSTSSGSETEFEPQKTTINICGKRPNVQNGEVVETKPMFLKYQCNSFYLLVGPEKVECYSNGKWSEVPTCKVAHCVVDTDERDELVSVGEIFVKNGEKLELKCVRKPEWWFENSSVATCTDGTLTLSRCCSQVQIKTKTC